MKIKNNRLKAAILENQKANKELIDTILTNGKNSTAKIQERKNK